MKRTIRRLARKFGFDIVPFKAGRDMGVNPFYDMAKLVKSANPVLFDVGANQGQSIIRYREVFKTGTIHSFEPSPAAFQVLKENASKEKNANAWNYGVGSEAGTLMLNENKSSVMSSFLELGEEGWGEVEKQTAVEVITLDSFINEQSIPQVDVLKIDTQGFELEVLKGAKESMEKGKIGLVYFEVNFIKIYDKQPSFTDLYTFCIDCGYELVSIYPIRHKNGVAGWTDAMFKHKSYSI